MKSPLIRTIVLTILCGSCARLAAQTVGPQHIGPGKIVVKSKFGAQIYSYDIDRNGTEGILNEYKILPNGKTTLSAIETFDQATGVRAETLRSSLWVREAGNGQPGSWRMRFHQGTRVP